MGKKPEGKNPNVKKGEYGPVVVEKNGPEEGEEDKVDIEEFDEKLNLSPGVDGKPVNVVPQEGTYGKHAKLVFSKESSKNPVIGVRPAGTPYTLPAGTVQGPF